MRVSKYTSKNVGVPEGNSGVQGTQFGRNTVAKEEYISKECVGRKWAENTGPQIYMHPVEKGREGGGC